MRLPSPHSGGAPLRQQRGQARPQAALLLCSPAGLVAWQGAGVDVLQVEVGLGGGVGGVREGGLLAGLVVRWEAAFSFGCRYGFFLWV